MHQIDTNGWQTTINGLMRPIPNDINPETAIVDFDQEAGTVSGDY